MEILVNLNLNWTKRVEFYRLWKITLGYIRVELKKSIQVTWTNLIGPIQVGYTKSVLAYCSISYESLLSSHGLMNDAYWN